MWSWCGQVDGTESDINTYLSLMSGLEAEYPAVNFVYMTGHLTGTGEAGNVNVRNQQIRDYCAANNKILYDFADIESYDPDGAVNYMQLFANDNCDYDSNGDEVQDRNWATDWQGAHTENVDWYSCSCAHSQPLNGNRKAYAAWWMFSRMAGWNQPATHSITVTQGAHGSITPAGMGGVVTVYDGADQSFAITPDAGYRVADVTVDGSSAGAITSYTFDNVTAGHSIGATFTPAPQSSWYLAEGSSKWGFETWLLIQNPGGSNAACRVTYMLEGEDPLTVEKRVPANSRKSYNMKDDIGEKDASIKVQADVPVIPERAMYWNSRGAGTDTIGGYED